MAIVGMVSKRVFLVGLVIAALAGPALADKIASPAFTATNQNGRPMVGATIAITDSMGDSVLVCADADCNTTISNITSTGVFQFYQDPGTYNVTIAGSGVTRNFVVVIPAGVADALTDGDFSGSGFMRKTGVGTYDTVKYNLSAGVDPAVTDDSGDDYKVGSIWVNTNTDAVFFAADVSVGAAVWVAAGNSGVISSIEGESGPAIDLVIGTSGSDFNISIPSTNNIRFNLPSASTSARGAVSASSQEFGGLKTFDDGLISDDRLTVNNEQNSTGIFLVKTEGSANAILTDPTNDQIGFFSSSGQLLLFPSASVLFNESVSDNETARFVNGSDAAAIVAVAGGNGNSSIAINASTGSNADGPTILATSGGNNSRAGHFTRSTNAGTVPVVEIDRNNSSDTDELLELNDDSATTAAVRALTYRLNGTIMWSAETQGKFNGTILASGTPTYSFVGDGASGLGSISGVPVIYDDGTPIMTFDDGTGFITTTVAMVVADNSINAAITIGQAGAGAAIEFETNKFLVSGTGELQFAGVSGDGSGKVLCVKADDDIGTCTSVVGAGGDCTCA